MKPGTAFLRLMALALVCLAASAAAASGQSTAKPLTAAQVFALRQGCVYTIETDTKQGTGFAVDGMIWTCYHVVAGAKTIQLERQGEAPIPVERVLAADPHADVAILLPEGSVDAHALKMSNITSTCAVGDPLYVIGTPEGLGQTLTSGLLSAIRTQNGRKLLQLSASVSPGSSGSPVFDQYGNVAGMVQSQYKEGQQLNFAISAKALTAVPWGVPIGTALGGPTGGGLVGGNASDAPAPNSPSRFVAADSSNVLKGVTAVRLTADTSPRATRAGLTADAITHQVANQLRAAGLSLATKDEWLKSHDIPEIDVSVVGFTDRGFQAATFYVELGIEEDARIDRDRGRTRVYGVTTWDDGMVELTTPDAFVADAMKAVTERVDHFLADYRKANPPPQ
ncbi:MAG: trypsin-like peptidase domain-containing protein [Armatimonadetes bacterium]|nr:trypsin-like peptidase domain-containing protein [Armatimonadota bacterium]MDE2205839.1 trypsin-like peptidase domain-containing protein [Armatimonadota bacterium]